MGASEQVQVQVQEQGLDEAALRGRTLWQWMECK
jgi:hypothetical protein